mmetsp:Transcript_29083/g.49079  ORF Transcript_29083/g.49079 Transcript_29083/m.49079 type:complete len:119 (-) Transcript_29083:38-394(-)
MYLRGFRNLCFFYVCWLGGSAIIPFAIVTAYFKLTYIPLYVLICYYSFRFFFKASKWNFMREALCTDDTPYCNSAQIIFEKGAKAPKPNSRVITSVAPHGILTLGWSFVISSRAFFNS